MVIIQPVLTFTAATVTAVSTNTIARVRNLVAIAAFPWSNQLWAFGQFALVFGGLLKAVV